jgi:hypothetical protein
VPGLGIRASLPSQGQTSLDRAGANKAGGWVFCPAMVAPDRLDRHRTALMIQIGKVDICQDWNHWVRKVQGLHVHSTVGDCVLRQLGTRHSSGYDVTVSICVALLKLRTWRTLDLLLKGVYEK